VFLLVPVICSVLTSRSWCSTLLTVVAEEQHLCKCNSVLNLKQHREARQKTASNDVKMLTVKCQQTMVSGICPCNTERRVTGRYVTITAVLQKGKRMRV
jgi:hypothetical protein